MHHPTDRITHTTDFVTLVMEHWLEREIYMYVCIYIYVCVYVYMYVCIYMYMCIYVYICVYIICVNNLCLNLIVNLCLKNPTNHSCIF